MVKILFVCLGNICRSTMAECVMKYLVKEQGLEKHFQIDSAGTSDEETGNPVHHGTRHRLQQAGIPCGGHRARQMTAADYDRFDLLIGMEEANLRAMRRITGGDPAGKIHKLLNTLRIAGISQIPGIQGILMLLLTMCGKAVRTFWPGAWNINDRQRKDRSGNFPGRSLL